MLSKLIRRLLFNFIHLVVNVVVLLQNVYHKIIYKRRTITRDKINNNDIKMILEHMPRMSKTPKHVVLLPDFKHQCLSDLARVVIWSLVAGIPYVSFYDETGELKKNEDELFYEIEKNKIGIPGCIKWKNKPDLNGYTNGITAHTVNFNIFSCYDGRPTIAQCIQLIAEEKISVRRKSNELTAQEFEDALALVYPSMPDPDLLLYSGPLCSTRGLLPWQIRLTEFVQFSLDYSINVENYIGAMYKYNKCDQRFGK